MTNWTRIALAYPYNLTDRGDLRGLPTDVLRRHAALALSVNRFDVSAEYQAELSRRAIPLNEMEAAA